IQLAKFVPSSYQLYKAGKKEDSAVEAYKDFIKQTVMLFSEDKDINVTTQIAQDIFDFEVNLTKKYYDFDFELPDFPDDNSTYDYPYDYQDVSSSTIEPELVELHAERIREAHEAVIQNTTWMDNETKEEAKNKLKNVVFKIGYPEEIYKEEVLKDMYKHVGNMTRNDPFLDIYLTFRKNNAINKLQKVHSPHNRRKEWSHEVAEVFAAYLYLENSVVLTAVTLQHPFYSSGLPSSVKMGTLGWILGHELNHGFFYPGSYYDENGNKRNWWNNETTQNFKPLEQCVEELYDQTEEETGLNISGYRTFDENIADIKGLQTAFEAHRKLLTQHSDTPQRLPCMTEFNADQLFFISLAYSFCQNDQDAELRDIVERDSHSPSKI
ncbi:hypothetical protein HPB47_004351, partial [Ixodes persulcatus]